MNLSNIRQEVMQTLEKSMDEFLEKFIKPIEEIWQPQDMLPNSNDPQFIMEVQEIQELAKDLDDDLITVLIGDTITEEALPTYEAWLMDIAGVNQHDKKGWSQWVRAWTAEENRHGDLLNKYLYLSGRVDMRQVEISTQYLIHDGIDIKTAKDPYRSFVYTSFQELATNLSHRRVALQAKKSGNYHLSKMCGYIASDENRHANAYKNFVARIFELDPSEMMLAFEDMMRKKIIMPAHHLRESGGKIGELFAHFSDAAQRTLVYTTQDYIDIMNSLIKEWNIGDMNGLTGSAEKARDYIMGLPERLQRISERMTTPTIPYQFKWIAV
ncbi:MAG: acyl-ACP desaturase [Bacteroidales bacterium]|nr:acyl-ACP desaturase [Bacteroidales bacterium]